MSSCTTPSRYRRMGGDTQPFLENVGVAAVHEIRVVGQVADPGHQPVLMEDGLEQHEVVEVGAAAGMGVVADEHVAGPHVVYVVPGQHVVGDSEQRAEVDRDPLGLRHDPALWVEQRRGAVLPLLDVGREGSADDGAAHLLDDGGQRAADHLDGNRIDWPGHADSSVIIRFRKLSTVAVWPGSSSVVLSICSMIAGPGTAWPGPRRSRSNTEQGCTPPNSGR